ncbi:MAG: transcriptional regulator, AraC family [Firmicutes bacterium]|nr:transcriptional regulator, AraC family [Bacillota bacterium]
MSINFLKNTELPYFELKTCSHGFECRKHIHNEFSLGIVEHGHSNFWANGNVNTIGPGNVIIIPSQIVHSCMPKRQDNWKYKMLFINEAWFATIIKKNNGLKRLAKAAGFIDRSLYYRVESLLSCLFEAGNPLEQETRVIALLDQLAQNEPSICNETSRYPTHGLKKVKEYICDNFKDKILLDDLVNISGFSKFHLVRFFQQIYFLPPHALQTVLRINYAKQDLKKGRRIVDVAVETGFADQSHFTRTFKKYVGITPEAYQISSK